MARRGGHPRVYELPLAPRPRPNGTTSAHRYSIDTHREYRPIDEMERRIEYLRLYQSQWQEAADTFRRQYRWLDRMRPKPRELWRETRENLIEALTAVAGAEDLIEATQRQLSRTPPTTAGCCCLRRGGCERTTDRTRRS